MSKHERKSTNHVVYSLEPSFDVTGHRQWSPYIFEQLIANEHVFNSDSVYRNIKSESVFKNFRIQSTARFALFLALFKAITYIVCHRSYIRLSPMITTDRRTRMRSGYPQNQCTKPLYQPYLGRDIKIFQYKHVGY